MTDNEAAALYELLLNSLRQHRRSDEGEGLLGFPEVIEGEIAAGRPQRVKIKVGSEQLVDDAIAGTRTGSARAEFVGRQPFSPRDRLVILCDGVGLARVAPALMAHRIVNTSRSVDPAMDLQELRFADDRYEEATRILTFEAIQTGVLAVLPLQKALEKVRMELVAGPVEEGI